MSMFDFQSAVVGLNLKAGPNRPDLMIIYLHWNEQKRKILACVAELKSHLVRQIQVGRYTYMYLYLQQYKYLCVHNNNMCRMEFLYKFADNV